MRLSPEAWAEIEARWQALPDLNACMPEQRRDFLLREEAALDEIAILHIVNLQQQGRQMEATQ
jgi:hypothetical protein